MFYYARSIFLHDAIGFHDNLEVSEEFSDPEPHISDSFTSWYYRKSKTIITKAFVGIAPNANVPEYTA